MPRNASGTYALPPGNPVVSQTPITTSWANPTMSDIGTEITNSLDRSGRGGMLGPFKIFDGDINNPGLAFINTPSMGMWAPSNVSMHFAIGGVDLMVLQGVGLISKSYGQSAKVSTGISGAYALNAALAQSHIITMSGATQVTVSNLTAGSVLRLLAKNVTTALTFTNVSWPSAVVPDLTAGSLKVAVIVITSDGTTNFASSAVY